ncbi:KilA-N domain-containing protein [Moraxella bovis]|uniref:KilA-N domain-containing protein n=1 Tax=Moraxella bovis TaxID=476 RepID=UPI002225BC6F|nr:KilA-N domain-containing protein [Moraxella bovis]UZA25344.1 KilA-N domain-containing protein [Moraxella bovis]UZA29166.1 KilA-N domain-containing protein [Moraxella bovis]
MNNLSVANIAISTYNNLFSLNDLHKASGNEKRHAPALFLRNDQTKDLIHEIESENTIAYHTVNGGANRGTYACEELVYAYAMWISAKFNLMVIRAFKALNTGAIPCLETPKLSDNQAYQIQKAIKQKCLNNKVHYQTIYHALYDEFGVKSYKDILASEFEQALAFIESFVFTPNLALVHNILADQAHQNKKAKGELNEIIGVVRHLLDHIGELQHRLDVGERNIRALQTRFII